MIIALLAILLDPQSRATNILRALRMVEEAAQLDPAPDVIVMALGCDRIRSPKHTMTRAMIEMFSESMAAKAREWGVVLAIGRADLGGGADKEVGVLFDVDGDESHEPPGILADVDQHDRVTWPIQLLVEPYPEPAVNGMPTVILGRPVEQASSEEDDRKSCAAVSRETASRVCLVRAAFERSSAAPCVSHSPGVDRVVRTTLSHGLAVSVHV